MIALKWIKQYLCVFETNTSNNCLKEKSIFLTNHTSNDGFHQPCLIKAEGQKLPNHYSACHSDESFLFLCKNRKQSARQKFTAIL